MRHIVMFSGGSLVLWLPLEGDWLDLLEAEGWTWVEFRSTVEERIVTCAEFDCGAGPEIEWGDDRLTALARLYAAVRGIDLGEPRE